MCWNFWMSNVFAHQNLWMCAWTLCWHEQSSFVALFAFLIKFTCKPYNSSKTVWNEMSRSDSVWVLVVMPHFPNSFWKSLFSWVKWRVDAWVPYSLLTRTYNDSPSLSTGEVHCKIYQWVACAFPQAGLLWHRGVLVVHHQETAPPPGSIPGIMTMGEVLFWSQVIVSSNNVAVLSCVKRKILKIFARLPQAEKIVCALFARKESFSWFQT